MASSIAVCVATYRRHALLRRLLESLAAVETPEGSVIEVRLVDNDAEGSSTPTIEALQAQGLAPKKLLHAIEPKQGIADARNRAVEMGPADFFVFVDDDEWVEPDWLVSLMRTQVATGADVVLGSVSGILPPGAPSWLSRGGFYNKEVGVDGTVLDWRSGRTSNTLVAGRWFNDHGLRFDPRFGRSGGSDSDLFFRLAKLGGRLVACDSARVREDVEPNRASLRWLILRSYRNGMVFQRVARESRTVTRALWRISKAFVLLLKGLPGALIGRPETWARAAMLGSIAAGGLKAALRPDSAEEWVEYGKRPQEPQSGESSSESCPRCTSAPEPAAAATPELMAVPAAIPAPAPEAEAEHPTASTAAVAPPTSAGFDSRAPTTAFMTVRMPMPTPVAAHALMHVPKPTSSPDPAPAAEPEPEPDPEPEPARRADPGAEPASTAGSTAGPQPDAEAESDPDPEPSQGPEPKRDQNLTDNDWDEPVGWQLPFVDLLLAMSRHLIYIIVVAACALGLAVHQLRGIVPEYTATSVSLVLPRDKASFDASVDTGSLETSESTPRQGASASFTLPPNVDLYVMLMKARSNMERVAEQFSERLIEKEGMPRDHRAPERARFLSSMTKITGTEDGMISVVVTSRDPELAADIANEMTAASDIDSREIERKLLARQANVLQKSAEAASVELESVRELYADFSDRHSILEPALQAAGVVDDIQHFEKTAAKIESEIKAELTRFREESATIVQMRAKLAETRASLEAAKSTALAGAGVNNYGRINMEFRRLSQLLEFRQDLVLVLSSQAEIYRIRSEQATGPVVVIRPASAPTTPSGPSKKKIAIVPLMLGTMLAVGGSLVMEQLKAVKRSSELMNKVNEISVHMKALVPNPKRFKKRA